MLSVYLLLLIAFLILTILIYGTGFGGFDVDAAADADLDGPELGAGGFHHPFTLSGILFMGLIFSATGYILEDGKVASAWIPWIALPVGGIVGSGVYYMLYRVFVRSQGDSTVRVQELVGMKAVVTVPISAGSDGQVVVIHDRSGRVLYSAQSEETLTRDAHVVVTDRVGSILVVRSLSGLQEAEADA